MNAEFLQRAKRAWSRHGSIEFTKKSFRYAYQQAFISDGSSIYQESREEGNVERWQLIEPHLSNDDAFMLDVGCNAGYFCKRAAERGISSLGIDLFANEETLNAALDTLGTNPGVGIMRMTLTPESIDKLPPCDVALLLSIYHHWYSEFGEEAAMEMLGSFSDAEKIFFEPPSESHRYVETGGPKIDSVGIDVSEPNFEDNDRDSIINYHTDLLTSVFGETHDVTVLGGSDRMGTRRYLFYLSEK